nr:VIER F-box protein 2 [Tanacetum cinerariifolium]
MTKVIKGEFKIIKDVKVEDISLTCDTPLKVFNNEVSRLSRMDDDLFTYEVEVANIPCDSKMDDDSEHEANDDMGYDPSDVSFTEWLGSKNFNYKTMDHYTMKALWIYWIRGDDEVEFTDEEFSDNEDEVAKVFRIDANLFEFETPMCKAFKEFNYLLQIDPDLLTKDIEGFKTYEDYKNDWIYEWNKDVPWVDEKPWTNAKDWTKPTPVKHTCKPFNYKTGCSEWPTCSWNEDGYCNGGNLPEAYHIRNSLHYQNLEWYDDLEDSELKDEALWNKAIMEGFINNDESSNKYLELPVCNIRKFKMIKYSFGQDEEYVAVKEDEYDDLARTSNDACQTYQEIFRRMDEGWMVTRE